MGKRLSNLSRARIMNAHSRTVGRRNHAELRLVERFGVEYTKVKNIIDNGGAKLLLECRNGDRIHVMFYMGHEIYFSTYLGEIKTFLTREMVEESFPEIFNPPKKQKQKKKKSKKKKRPQPKLIPASELFKGK